MDASEQKHPSIVILGAGIAGLALAIGLSRRGVPCTVYDVCDEFSAVGAGIGLGPNSLAAMDLLDPRLRQRYDAAKTANESEALRHAVFDALRAEPGFGAARGWTRGHVGAPYFERSSAHRRDLLDIMAGLVPPGTVRFGRRAEEVVQDGARVRVRFADGGHVDADAVVGADGIRGVSRAAVLGAAAPDCVAPRYSGVYAFRGIAPMADAKAALGEHGGDAKWFMARGRGLVVYPISRGAEANLVFFVADGAAGGDDGGEAEWPDAGGGVVACAREDMARDLAGFDGRLLGLLAWARPLRWPLFHHPRTPAYHRGRVCLLGDAAHAMTPYQAAGAGQGLEDAAVLAHLLARVGRRRRRPGDVEAAFRAYDGVRRPRAEEVGRTSAEAGAMYMFLSPEHGDDMQSIVDNANGRFHWIWQHDLKGDLLKAEEEFLALTRSTEEEVVVEGTG